MEEVVEELAVEEVAAEEVAAEEVEEMMAVEEAEEVKWEPNDMPEELPKREAAIVRAENELTGVRPRDGAALCGRCFRLGKFVRVGVKLWLSRRAGAAGWDRS